MQGPVVVSARRGGIPRYTLSESPAGTYPRLLGLRQGTGRAQPCAARRCRTGDDGVLRPTGSPTQAANPVAPSGDPGLAERRQGPAGGCRRQVRGALWRRGVQPECSPRSFAASAEHERSPRAGAPLSYWQPTSQGSGCLYPSRPPNEPKQPLTG
eukprot:scaffold517_cov392-Prasinococcus_capsulatus_cf.AAC.5